MEQTLTNSVTICWFQVDDPVLVRCPDKAIEYAIDHLGLCFEGVPTTVNKCIHLCCGYPLYLVGKRHICNGIYTLASANQSTGLTRLNRERKYLLSRAKIFASAVSPLYI